MAIINFQCKKCKKEFDCETGIITFGNILNFEKDIICPKCGKLTKDELELTELGQTDIGEIYFSKEDTNEKSVLDLCNTEGTGLDVINDSNRERFYPLLLGIEEIIYFDYQEDSSLEDSKIIESLKKIRDNIFYENIKFNPLENKIITKIKRILFLNSYSKKDVLLSLSKILNSVKLHRSLEGKIGYLNRKKSPQLCCDWVKAI